MNNYEEWLNQVVWTKEGLVPVIAQDINSGRVMMLAWMNREALAATATKGKADADTGEALFYRA